ncbi:DUF559 domain-containing protein [Laspinema sp. D1]|uniref:DUF559 domain-containing protein n=1 Tax=Laspinema palackyanum TaxID=3231601 RepID=UPI00348E6777|nr:DUF559 domain-containing protein [Laspinema sp. D2b]
MVQLEDLTRGTTIKGIIPHQNITVIDTQWHGSDAVEIIYKDANGQLHNQILYRHDECTLEIVTEGQPWSFNGNGALLRLVSEAHRIRLAHLFDPLLAVHTSLVEPLPHQISAVYEVMLTRQPLRFLLADDPGAGKTIMAGLLIRELLIRGDLQRCLIVCPGSLAVQWQDELFQKFHLRFEILTNDRIESAHTGNAFTEMPLLICRLDKLSRNDDLQAKLSQTDWDLVVVDEAHKMSASFFGGEVRETKRYKLGKLLSTLTRHFLLMTATPHNGKEEDFQLFLALLDGDRFEGRFRDGVHVCDTSDLIRRLVKEDLLKFDSTPLFPERRAHTVEYALSDLEAVLYKQVTDYVKDEFNRAEALMNDGRRGTVGFALTILQRRLASSPEAIYQSLQRRRNRLQKRLREEEIFQRGLTAELENNFIINPEDLDDDFEESNSDEREATEAEVVDLATAARTIAELQVEIHCLEELEKLALKVRRSGKDRKWEELSKILQNRAEMFDAGGHRRKLVIFTEHRDTLNYLTERIRTLLGRSEAVVTIHGGMGREERKKAEEAFKQDVTVEVLIATDAAGEGINLQRSHLMVNYDLPWNPNRLEQRFGRIHRIGQTEVCHLWNLLAGETREGDVYLSLLRKLEIEQKALGGKVFDVLGKAIAGKELRELLIEAIRYGDRPDIKAKLNQFVADRLDRVRLEELLEERALARDIMDATRVQQIREDMERAQARKIQPHFIASFFLEAFQRLGGSIRQREPQRYEITNVPATLRNRDRLIGMGEPILRRYERICFEKDLISVPGKPLADFVCPGHPLLDATLDLTLERHRDLLRQGAILVDETDFGEEVRALIYLEHSIQDARTDKEGRRRVVSRRMQYVEIGLGVPAGLPPHPLTPSPTKGEGGPEVRGTSGTNPHPPLTLPPLSPGGRGAGGEGDYLAPLPPHPLTPSPTRGEGGPEVQGTSGTNPHPPLTPLSPGGRGAGGEGDNWQQRTPNSPLSPTPRKGEQDRWEISPALRKRMTEIARQLRKQQTPSEKILWQAIRGKKLDDRKFRRQQPIGAFVVDFFCAAERLIVEVDGAVHNDPEQKALDTERQFLLESLGLRFVRLSATEVETDLSTCLEQIRQAFSPLTLPPLSPGGRGAGGEGDYVQGNPPHPLTPSPTRGEGGPEVQPTPATNPQPPLTLPPLSPGGRGAGGEGELPKGATRNAGYAPYLNYRPLTESETSLVESPIAGLGLRHDIENQATSYAIAHLVPQHLQEIRTRQKDLIDKTVRAVKDRLLKEINYWDHRATDLRVQEQAGKPNAKLNSAKAQQRADDLAARLQKRLTELEQECKLSPLPPVVVGGALVIPIGLLQRLQGIKASTATPFARETKRVELRAMATVMAAEQALGYQPRDVSASKCGYDIESRNPETGHLRFVEVKGRIETADTVTVTKNEVITALNQPDHYVLALVQVPLDPDGPEETASNPVTPKDCILRYVHQPFQREPDFGVCSVNYEWKELWNRGQDIAVLNDF